MDVNISGDRIEVIYVEETLGLVSPDNKKVFKDIYKAEGDKIVYINRVYGKIIPPSYSPEKIEF